MSPETAEALAKQRTEIAEAIQALVIPKDISSDWYAAGVTTQKVCAIIASQGLRAEEVMEMGKL